MPRFPGPFGVRPEGTTLGVKVYLVTAMILIPAAVGVYLYSVRSSEQTLEKDWEVRALLAARTLDDRFASYNLMGLDDAQHREVQRELARLAETRPSIVATTLYAYHEGDLLFVTSQGSRAQNTPSVEDRAAVREDRVLLTKKYRGGEPFWEIAAPLHRGHEVCGALQMLLSLEETNQVLGRLRRDLFLGAAVILIITAIALTLYIRWSVTRPIQRLVDSMEAPAKGDMSSIVDVRVGGEIGWLAANFNHMMRQLKRTLDENAELIARVRDFNEELQRKIDAATEELAVKNAQLEATHEKLFKLQRQIGNLERLASLGQLASNIAHELGTPLNAISGHLEMLQQDHLEESAVARIRVIANQVDRLAATIRNVLKTLRLPEPNFENLSLNDTVQGIVDLVKPASESRGIVIETRLEKKLPAVRADAYQMEQVLMNLLTNAMDAMPSGGCIILETRFVNTEGEPITPSASANDPHAELRVRDTGQGMDEETKKRIFEPFFTTKAVGAGSGLGLTICREIVAGHGGRLHAESEPGKGSTFIVRLPYQHREVLMP